MKRIAQESPSLRTTTTGGRSSCRRRRLAPLGVLASLLGVAAPAAVLAGTLLLSPAAARADDADALRAQIEGSDEAARTAAFKALEGRPGQIGAVLGPLLRRSPSTEAATRAAAWLVERPTPEGGVLLIADVLRRGDTDPAFPRALASALGVQAAGWGRYVSAATAKARDAAADEEERRGAVAFLAADPTVKSMGVLAEVWGTAQGELEREVAAALAEALAYRFPDAATARAWAAAQASTPFLDAVRTLSASKDTPAHPIYRRMVRDSKAVIDRTTTLKELETYLRPRETPWPEVRRLAAEQGYRVSAKVGEWLSLLADVLREEDDPETLRRLLLVAATLQAEDGASMRAPALADAIVLRLKECCTLPKLQQGLLDLLARVGDTTAVEAAQPWALKAGDPATIGSWLRAAAAVGGLDDRICAIHQSHASSQEPRHVEIRLQALDALGARRAAGEGAWKLEAVARSYLYGILRREDAITDGMPRESAPSARAAAIRALEAFPDVGTYRRLRQLSESPPEPADLARLAGSVLAKLAVRDVEAALQLLDLAVSGNQLDARRDGIANLARVVSAGGVAQAPENDAERALRARIVAAVLALLDDVSAETALRTAAADVAAATGDPGLVGGVVTLVVSVSGSDAPRRGEAEAALERLVLAVARASGAHDGALTSALARLAKEGNPALAIRLADAAAEAGSARLALQTARAALRWARATTDPQTPGAPDAAVRRSDLVEGHRVLRSSLRTLASADTPAEVVRLAQRTHFQVADALLAIKDLEEGTRRTALFGALSAATALKDPALLDRAQAFLAEARALPGPVTDEERAVVEAFVEVTKRTAPPTPR